MVKRPQRQDPGQHSRQMLPRGLAPASRGGVAALVFMQAPGPSPAMRDHPKDSAPTSRLNWRRRCVVKLGVVGAHAQHPVPPIVSQEVGVAGPLKLQAEVAPDLVG